jgi:RNA-binding protein
MPETLTSAQKSRLKSQSQRLDATIKVGKAGLTDSFIAGLNRELELHELVKVKFVDFKEQKRELAPELATKTGSELIWLIGNVAVLFRQNPDPAKQKIKF